MRLLVVLSILGGMFYYAKSEQYFGLFVDESISKNGFVELPKLTNIKTDSVIIFAPQNCPKEGARRAAILAERLQQQNIPVMQSSSARFEHFDISKKRQVDDVMRGTIPVVIVDGWGKANPTFEEVVAEYDERGQSPLK